LELITAVIETNIWRLLDVLKEATRFLADKQIENPRLNAEILLSHILNVKRIDLYLRFEQPLNQSERQNFKSLLRRRAEGEPLQYILGETEFFSIPFLVSPHVLIPRPETELLVESAIETIHKKWDNTPIHCLDIGTGSGNIAIALAKNLKNVQVTAVDISEKAIAFAQKNAEKNGVKDRISFLIADALHSDFVETVSSSFDIICSNPPYINSNDLKKLPKEIKNFEPLQALDGGIDGLKFYQHLMEITPKLLSDSGTFFVEIGEMQTQAVQNIFSGNRFSIQIKKDLAQKDRLLIGQYKARRDTSEIVKEKI